MGAAGRRAVPAVRNLLQPWQSFPTHKHFVLQAVGHLARSRRRGGRGEGTHFWMVQAHARRVPAVWESECRACQGQPFPTHKHFVLHAVGHLPRKPARQTTRSAHFEGGVGAAGRRAVPAVRNLLQPCLAAGTRGQSFPTHKHFVLHTVGNLPRPSSPTVASPTAPFGSAASSRVLGQSFPTHKHFVLQAVGHLARSRRRGGRGRPIFPDTQTFRPTWPIFPDTQTFRPTHRRQSPTPLLSDGRKRDRAVRVCGKLPCVGSG